MLDDPENEDLRGGVNILFDIENFRENSGLGKTDNEEVTVTCIQWIADILFCRDKRNDLEETDDEDEGQEGRDAAGQRRGGSGICSRLFSCFTS